MINKTRPQYLIGRLCLAYMSSIYKYCLGCYIEKWHNIIYNAYKKKYALTELHIDTNNRSPHMTSHPRNYQHHLNVFFSFLSPERDVLAMSSPQWKQHQAPRALIFQRPISEIMCFY